MLNKIISFSLQNRMMVLIISVLLLISGLMVSWNTDVDVFPDLTAPSVAVMTDAHNLAAEEVEKLVTFPIETALNGATGVRRVRSTSMAGFSIVWVDFAWGTDIYKARQIVNEKLAPMLDHLPIGVTPPVLDPQSSIMGEIMLIGMTSDSLSPFDLRTIADRQVKQRLLSVSGVSQVLVMGGLPKEYQVLADPEKMKYHNVTLSDLIFVCRDINSNSSGGFIQQYGQEYVIRGMSRTTDLNDISGSFVKMNGAYPVTIRDVATVKEGYPPKIGDAFLNAKPAVIMTVLKQPNINTLRLTESIDKVVHELEKTLPSTVKIQPEIFRQSDFISTSIRNVETVLLEGGIFVAIILFLFLLNLRTTFISLIAIPLSLLVSLITLRLFGLTVNTMSLGGMAIAIGILVDDAIVEVENVLKRLRQNYKLPPAQRKKTLSVIYDASVEIQSSIVQATLIIIIAFAPLFFLSGMEGRMLRPLGITFIVSLFASLLVAITLTPVMASYLLTTPKQLNRHEKGDNVFIQRLNIVYERSLDQALRFKKVIIGSSLILLIAAFFLLTKLGSGFLPEFNEGTLTITTITIPGISIDQSNEIADQIDHALLTIPEVKNVSRRTGRAEANTHIHGGINGSEIDVPYHLSKRTREEFMTEVRDKLGKVQGMYISIGQPLGHRIDHMLSGTRASIAIKLFGQDLNTLYTTANEIKNKISAVEGLVDLNVDQLVDVPQIQIKPRREMLARYGIPVNKFNEFVEVALGGEKMSDVFESQMSFNLVLKYDAPFRNTMESLENTYIDTYDGKKIPLSFVADIVSSTGPYTINRENVQRKIVISANTAGRDVGSIVMDVEKIIDRDVRLPENYHIEYGGQFESARMATRMLLFTSILAVFIIFLILYREFRNMKLAGIVLLNLPLALIGGVFALWITSGVLSIPAIIGFITLFGIATRNGILLVSKYQHLIAEGKSTLQAILAGSSDRLNPILMTALASGLALVPLIIYADKPGNEIQSPMAVVILGGLFTSTILNLYVIPIVYSWIFKNRPDENKI
ncbi:MAG: efflux RND transporter permease subunit [Bacteroidota bacterium]